MKKLLFKTLLFLFCIALIFVLSSLNLGTTSPVLYDYEQQPPIPKQILVCGGGRKNQTLMQTLQNKSSIPLRAVEKVGWSGDDMEAQLIAFLAVRSFYGLPISFPTTTGVPSPTTGGSTFHPS